MESYSQMMKRKQSEEMAAAAAQFKRRGGKVYMARPGESGHDNPTASGSHFDEINRRKKAAKGGKKAGRPRNVPDLVFSSKKGAK